MGKHIDKLEKIKDLQWFYRYHGENVRKKALTMIYQWVKVGAISKKEFINLIEVVNEYDQ